jgi:hypothetical protein
MKVIFLDIDGVLNSNKTVDRMGRFVGLDPVNIENFNKIIEAHPDAKIVISSTWRELTSEGYYSNFKELIDLLHNRGLKGEIIDKTPSQYTWKYRCGTRGGEISEWKQGRTDLGQYVILDDDSSASDGIPEHQPRHVLTTLGNNALTLELGGLRDKHVAKAIAILNGILE